MFPTILSFVFVVCATCISASSSALPEIWYGSTPLAPDIGQMYISPGTWSQTQHLTRAIKFYAQQFRRDCPSSACGIANLTYFEQIDAFEVLRNLNLDIAIEGGSLKDWDCDGAKCLNYMFRVVENVLSEGSRVSFIDMDEPYFAALHWCKLSMTDAANRVVNNFIKPLRANVSHHISIGDIEPYPALSAKEILAWLDQMKNLGAQLSHFHVDVDFHAVGKNLKQARTDLLSIRDYCDQNHLTFAAIINPAGFSPTTSQQYYEETMKNVRWWIDNLGHPEPGYPSSRVIFQSWEPNVPNNVPETAPNTGT